MFDLLFNTLTFNHIFHNCREGAFKFHITLSFDSLPLNGTQLLLKTTVDGFIFMDTNFRLFKKKNGTFVGFKICGLTIGSVPVDFLRPKFRVAHTKRYVISSLMNKYTYINMYIIKKIISCRFILCWDITALLKLKWKVASYV